MRHLVDCARSVTSPELSQDTRRSRPHQGSTRKYSIPKHCSVAVTVGPRVWGSIVNKLRQNLDIPSPAASHSVVDFISRDVLAPSILVDQNSMFRRRNFWSDYNRQRWRYVFKRFVFIDYLWSPSTDRFAILGGPFYLKTCEAHRGWVSGREKIEITELARTKINETYNEENDPFS